MSWQSYVDDHLMCALPHGGALKTAAIVGQDGAVWAQSAAFPAITPAQVAAIVEGFDEAGKLAEKGLWIGDEKFMVVQGDPGVVIRGRNKEEKEKNRKVGGCCIKKTTSALVFGIFEEPVTPGDTNVVVENLGDYLIGQGI
eukprot:TRINITY_DN455_c0_g1_i2.p2 TRINITY_DN455_c0_g1~~TRINITY_DN455_c0_g1_i2.p2  ORF type:complete len:141 (+),score=24.95 TRINITY_DN455_c0_g1_i2:166-588(+)